MGNTQSSRDDASVAFSEPLAAGCVRHTYHADAMGTSILRRDSQVPSADQEDDSVPSRQQHQPGRVVRMRLGCVSAIWIPPADAEENDAWTAHGCKTLHTGALSPFAMTRIKALAAFDRHGTKRATRLLEFPDWRKATPTEHAAMLVLRAYSAFHASRTERAALWRSAVAACRVAAGPGSPSWTTTTFLDASVNGSSDHAAAEDPSSARRLIMGVLSTTIGDVTAALIVQALSLDGTAFTTPIDVSFFGAMDAKSAKHAASQESFPLVLAGCASEVLEDRFLSSTGYHASLLLHALLLQSFDFQAALQDSIKSRGEVLQSFFATLLEFCTRRMRVPRSPEHSGKQAGVSVAGVAALPPRFPSLAAQQLAWGTSAAAADPASPQHQAVDPWAVITSRTTTAVFHITALLCRDVRGGHLSAVWTIAPSVLLDHVAWDALLQYWQSERGRASAEDLSNSSVPSDNVHANASSTSLHVAIQRTACVCVIAWYSCTIHGKPSVVLDTLTRLADVACTARAAAAVSFGGAARADVVRVAALLQLSVAHLVAWCHANGLKACLDTALHFDGLNDLTSTVHNRLTNQTRDKKHSRLHGWLTHGPRVRNWLHALEAADTNFGAVVMDLVHATRVDFDLVARTAMWPSDPLPECCLDAAADSAVVAAELASFVIGRSCACAPTKRAYDDALVDVGHMTSTQGSSLSSSASATSFSQSTTPRHNASWPSKSFRDSAMSSTR